METNTHIYELHNFEGDTKQVIYFIKKEVDAEGNVKTVQNGTTNEDVLNMIVHRLEDLNKKMESHYNVNAINHIKEALDQLNRRTADRLQRGVEGTHQE